MKRLFLLGAIALLGACAGEPEPEPVAEPVVEELAEEECWVVNEQVSQLEEGMSSLRVRAILGCNPEFIESTNGYYSLYWENPDFSRVEVGFNVDDRVWSIYSSAPSERTLDQQ